MLTPSNTPTARQLATERTVIMIKSLKWMLIELLIRHRVLAPCRVRADRSYRR